MKAFECAIETRVTCSVPCLCNTSRVPTIFLLPRETDSFRGRSELSELKAPFGKTSSLFSHNHESWAQEENLRQIPAGVFSVLTFHFTIFISSLCMLEFLWGENTEHEWSSNDDRKHEIYNREIFSVLPLAA